MPFTTCIFYGAEVFTKGSTKRVENIIMVILLTLYICALYVYNKR